MNIWLCPVKPKSWRIIKNTKIYGAPRLASKIMSQVKPNDLLVFHVLKPINGIVAVCRVTSRVYEDNKDIWGKDRYPLRVKIEFIQNLLTDESTPIPISRFFGENAHNEFKIEPYLKNVWITKLTKEQYNKLENAFRKSQKKKQVRIDCRVRLCA